MIDDIGHKQLNYLCLNTSHFFNSSDNCFCASLTANTVCVVGGMSVSCKTFCSAAKLIFNLPKLGSWLSCGVFSMASSRFLLFNESGPANVVLYILISFSASMHFFMSW